MAPLTVADIDAARLPLEPSGSVPLLDPAWQSGRGVAEIVALATLSSYRGRGLAASLSAALARSALAEGNGLVFRSAADDRVAAIYARIGSKQVGTACVAELN